MKRSFFLLLFMGLGLSCLYAMSLQVLPIQGEAYQRELTTVGKLVYESDSLYLYDNMGTILYKEVLQKVRSLVYGDFALPTSYEAVYATQIRVYPNPTTSFVVVEQANGRPIHLYNQQGQALQTKSTGEGDAMVDMQGVPSGVYLLLVGTEAYKVIKE